MDDSGVSLPNAKTSWSLTELLAAEFPEPTWIVPELLPVGLAILAGRPKIGKSWLALQLALSVASGGLFFDRRLGGGRVLYYALEDSPRRIRRRLVKIQAPTEALLHFEFLTPPLNTEQGQERFWRVLDEARPRLVVVDTLTRAFDASADWNDVGIVTQSLGVLQWEAQQRDICILCIDHHRKSSARLERDSVADILGSTGKAAVADTLWGLYRQKGKRDIELDIQGRDMEDATLALDFDHLTCCWQCLGDAQGVKRDTLKADVLQAIEDLGGESTTTEVAKHLGADAGNVSRAVGDLAATGRLLRGERRGKYVPYRLP
jgi:hypothetical protein